MKEPGRAVSASLYYAQSIQTVWACISLRSRGELPHRFRRRRRPGADVSLKQIYTEEQRSTYLCGPAVRVEAGELFFARQPRILAGVAAAWAMLLRGHGGVFRLGVLVISLVGARGDEGDGGRVVLRRARWRWSLWRGGRVRGSSGWHPSPTRFSQADGKSRVRAAGVMSGLRSETPSELSDDGQGSGGTGAGAGHNSWRGREQRAIFKRALSRPVSRRERERRW